MRLTISTLVILGVLSFGATFAVAQERPANAPTTTYLTTATDGVVVTPVQRYVYRPGPRWNGYYRVPPYYSYSPRYYGYGPPRYYAPYAGRYPGYYYGNGFNFQYRGPGASFGFGF